MLTDKRIGFLGGGRMGEAIVRGLLAAGVAPGRIVVSEPDSGRTDYLSRELGVHVTSDNAAAVEKSDVLVLAVKPHVLPAVVAGLQGVVTKKHLVISIAAGIRTAAIESALGQGIAVVRVMPNTPALIGEGVSALAPGSCVSSSDMDLACSLFGAVGKVVRVDEVQMDAVTGLSGSGPAYVYMFIQALAEGGVRAGLATDTALILAAQTVVGAAGMVLKTGEDPLELRNKVMTPGGTTVAGVGVLDEKGFSSAVMEAVIAAANRSGELGKK